VPENRRRVLDPDEEPVDPTLIEPQRVAFSKLGMVATAHHRATDAAAAVLAEGGNAIDAAVTAAFALGVCEPHASGLGGQTMMLIHQAEPRRTFALDGSSRAPNRATPESLTREERRRGYKATTVPSTPAVLAWALRSYGSIDLERAVAPSIQLAEEGVQVTALQNRLTRRELIHLKQQGAGRHFLRDGRRTPATGSSLVQPMLANTLRRLSREGIDDFYLGDIANAIHKDMESHGGLLRNDDLAQIPWPVERKPVGTRLGSWRVVTFPPPGAGRVLVEMLNILAELGESIDPDSPEGAVRLAEIMRTAQRDRRDRPYDPAIYEQIDDRRMVSRRYAREVAEGLRKRVKTHGETTHLSVMDRFGNAVGLTQSIESVYGSCVATNGLGFLYNNYMSAFEYDDMSHPYYMRPNAAPWASVAPTLLFRGKRPWIAIGSPGSERIVSAIVQVLLRLGSRSPLEAISAPRMHASAKGNVSLEAPRMRNDIPEALRAGGFEVNLREAYSFYLGCVQLVMRDRRGFVGVADPRRDGSAGGPIG
jgi:gamma-glutamyltranspeptidase/glutathione hydrolase